MKIKTNWDDLAYPRLCGLLGVNPSRLSQAMHNAGFADLGLKFNYHAFDTLDTNLALNAVKELGFRGLSLTIPHKEVAFSLVDKVSDEAKRIGAINTLINSGDALYGYNSDWFGIVEALREVSFQSKGSQALVLGAGGAARAAVYALQELEVSSILIANRTKQRADIIVKEFSREGKSVEAIELEESQKSLEADVSLIVNATPIGLKQEGEGSYPFDFSSLTKNHVVFDMVTKDTSLTVAAKKQGATVVLGIRMLLHQALRQFELFTEQKAPLRAMEEALIKEYQQ